MFVYDRNNTTVSRSTKSSSNRSTSITDLIRMVGTSLKDRIATLLMHINDAINGKRNIMDILTHISQLAVVKNLTIIDQQNSDQESSLDDVLTNYDGADEAAISQLLGQLNDEITLLKEEYQSTTSEVVDSFVANVTLDCGVAYICFVEDTGPLGYSVYFEDPDSQSSQLLVNSNGEFGVDFSQFSLGEVLVKLKGGMHTSVIEIMQNLRDSALVDQLYSTVVAAIGNYDISSDDGSLDSQINRISESIKWADEYANRSQQFAESLVALRTQLGSGNVLAVYNYVKNKYSSVVAHIESDSDSVIEFDVQKESDKYVMSAGVILSAVTMILSTVVSFIASAINPILGAVVTGITTVANNVIPAVKAMATREASWRWVMSYSGRISDVPLSHVILNSSSKNSLHNSIKRALFDYPLIKVNQPGCEIFMRIRNFDELSDNDRVNLNLANAIVETITYLSMDYLAPRDLISSENLPTLSIDDPCYDAYGTGQGSYVNNLTAVAASVYHHDGFNAAAGYSAVMSGALKFKFNTTYGSGVDTWVDIAEFYGVDNCLSRPGSPYCSLYSRYKSDLFSNISNSWDKFYSPIEDPDLDAKASTSANGVVDGGNLECCYRAMTGLLLFLVCNLSSRKQPYWFYQCTNISTSTLGSRIVGIYTPNSVVNSMHYGYCAGNLLEMIGPIILGGLGACAMMTTQGYLWDQYQDDPVMIPWVGKYSTFAEFLAAQLSTTNLDYGDSAIAFIHAFSMAVGSVNNNSTGVSTDALRDCITGYGFNTTLQKNVFYGDGSGVTKFPDVTAFEFSSRSVSEDVPGVWRSSSIGFGHNFSYITNSNVSPDGCVVLPQSRWINFCCVFPQATYTAWVKGVWQDVGIVIGIAAAAAAAVGAYFLVRNAAVKAQWSCESLMYAAQDDMSAIRAFAADPNAQVEGYADLNDATNRFNSTWKKYKRKRILANVLGQITGLGRVDISSPYFDSDDSAGGVSPLEAMGNGISALKDYVIATKASEIDSADERNEVILTTAEGLETIIKLINPSLNISIVN